MTDPHAVAEALMTRVRSGGAGVDEPLRQLRDLATAAAAGDAASEDAFQQVWHFLHYGDDDVSYELRRFLASSVYDVETGRADVTLAAKPLPHDALARLLKERQAEMDMLQLPIYRHMQEHPTREGLRVYFENRWRLQTTFWASLAEFASRIQRMNRFPNTLLVYKNVWEELGSGKLSEVHLLKFREVYRGAGIEASFDDAPLYTETRAYLNFRLLCMRHANPGWGLGAFYSVEEAVSEAYSRWHVQLLERHGLAGPAQEIDEAHDELDVEHAGEILRVIADLCTTTETQAACLAAQRRLTLLWQAHLNRVHQAILEAEGGAS